MVGAKYGEGADDYLEDTRNRVPATGADVSTDFQPTEFFPLFLLLKSLLACRNKAKPVSYMHVDGIRFF